MRDESRVYGQIRAHRSGPRIAPYQSDPIMPNDSSRETRPLLSGTLVELRENSFLDASSPLAVSRPAADDYSHPFFIVDRISRSPLRGVESSRWKRDSTPAIAI